jgi:hypothetical protein
MDVLELRVAAECKEAFAELQTEITEIGCEVQSAGKIFFSKVRYTCAQRCRVHRWRIVVVGDVAVVVCTPALSPSSDYRLRSLRSLRGSVGG